ncbi:hypothetical protein HJG60_008666 [Phyllostomus discolor]|uniref:Uncharacterized protein n=1 Tax=Phyllostomus discolor TaxID=89673 RepID=A0A833Z178_9CHIR|nr:hypothetical protein HJG60_008666 [Phyllostomus discolor]
MDLGPIQAFVTVDHGSSSPPACLPPPSRFEPRVCLGRGTCLSSPGALLSDPGPCPVLVCSWGGTLNFQAQLPPGLCIEGGGSSIWRGGVWRVTCGGLRWIVSTQGRHLRPTPCLNVVLSLPVQPNPQGFRINSPKCRGLGRAAAPSRPVCVPVTWSRAPALLLALFPGAPAHRGL